jgi:hypothetical protein
LDLFVSMIIHSISVKCINKSYFNHEHDSNI